MTVVDPTPTPAPAPQPAFVDPVERLLDRITKEAAATTDKSAQTELQAAIDEYNDVKATTLTNQITFYPITNNADIPNRQPIMFLKNSDRTDVYCGWFLTGGNAAGYIEAFYSYYWDLNKGWLFNEAGKSTLDGGPITHWGYPYPRGTTPPSPAVLDAMSGKDLPL